MANGRCAKSSRLSAHASPVSSGLCDETSSAPDLHDEDGEVRVRLPDALVEHAHEHRDVLRKVDHQLLLLLLAKTREERLQRQSMQVCCVCMSVRERR
eukprot:4075484-Pleurochrysis_carterae.AAC.1